MDLPRAAWALAVAFGALGDVHAGRPMATDDTSTLPRGECQVEAWGQRVQDDRSQSLAPACGVADDWEFDTQVTRVETGLSRTVGTGIGLKWAPADAVAETAWGALSAGAEAGLGWARSAGEGWRFDGVAVAALASLAIGPAWSVDANVGTARQRDDARGWLGFVRAAAAWQASERWLLFAEGLGAQHARPLWNSGLRCWLVPGTLALDVIASRSGGATSIGFGAGWYGLRLH